MNSPQKRKSDELDLNKEGNSPKRAKQDEPKKSEFESFDRSVMRIWKWHEDYKTTHLLVYVPKLDINEEHTYCTDSFDDKLSNNYKVVFKNDSVYRNIYGIYLCCNNFKLEEEKEIEIATNITLFWSKEIFKYFTHKFVYGKHIHGFNDILNIEPGKANNDFFVKFKIAVSTDKIQPINEIKFNGLANLGMTCYMNSAIQVLFSIKKFRALIFKIPTEKGNWKSPILNLQKLFYDLQANNETVISPVNFAKAIGIELGVQRDVHELLMMLLETIENSIKAISDLSKDFKQMLVGELCTIIHCKHVEQTSKKTEPYMAISLEVAGCDDVYASMEKFLLEENLDGTNLYETTNCGKQEAIRKTEFISFPDILMIHLKRFQYEQKASKKINDYYKISDSLDFTKYSNAQDSIYRLHAIIVHSGHSQSGHYYSCVKVKDAWYEFNDRNTSLVSDLAIMEHTGGKITEYKVCNNNVKPFETSSNSSAYILIYIKESQYLSIMPNELPSFESCRPSMESYINVEKKCLEAMNAAFFPVYLLGEEMITMWKGISIIPAENSAFSNSPKCRFKYVFPRILSIHEVQEQIANKLKVPSIAVGMWKIYIDTKGVQVEKITDNNKTIKETVVSKAGRFCVLFLKVIDPKKARPVFVSPSVQEIEAQKEETKSILDYASSFEKKDAIGLLSNEISEWKFNNIAENEKEEEKTKAMEMSPTSNSINSQRTEDIDESPIEIEKEETMLVFVKYIIGKEIETIKAVVTQKTDLLSSLIPHVCADSDISYHYCFMENNGKVITAIEKTSISVYSEGCIFIVHKDIGFQREESYQHLVQLYISLNNKNYIN